MDYLFREQSETPLYTALRRHIGQGCAHLHVPAHRQGEALPSLLKQQNFFQMDLTELPGLDNLHSPGGPIARAQELAAQLYGAEAAFFLVNGATAGLQALLLAACRPGEKIVVARDSHRSVLAGLVFSGADPVFVEPAVLDEFGIPAGIDPARLARVLEERPGARGVFAVYPNYYGVAAGLRDLVGVAHAKEKPFLVDEAHGAHFPFHPALPAEALACGADAAVISVHKTGGALTQSSFLLLNSDRLSKERVAAALSLLQTSSPSYLLMVSLDLARHQLATRGYELLQRSIALASFVRAELGKVPGLRLLTEDCLPDHLKGRCEGQVLDSTRITVNVLGLGLSGHQAARLLSEKYKVNCELADYHNIVVVIGIGVNHEDCRRLVHGLREIARWEARPAGRLPVISDLPVLPRKRMTPREAWLKPARTVSLKACAGLICAEWVAAYPPGVPVIYPGEEITPEIIEYLQSLKRNNVPVVGPADQSLANILVIDE
ncbi:MAG: aminotransferase class I/II-fold pyridoxal phosphate-dependent enzyme [Bacillota bacterium]